jgi:hypothetical protein
MQFLKSTIKYLHVSNASRTFTCRNEKYIDKNVVEEHCEGMTQTPGGWDGHAADQVCWSVDSNLAAFYTYTHIYIYYITICILSSDLQKIRLALDLSERNCFVSQGVSISYNSR